MRPEERVLPLLRPTRMQLVLLDRLYRLVKSAVEPCLGSRGINARASIQGSFAKGTLLSDKWEIDVFVEIHGVDREWLRRNAEQALRSCFARRAPAIAKYSQHPYLTVSVMGLEADVVPIARSGDKIIGLGVERTPLHTRYVLEKLSPEGKDEVRLLKSFFKGVGIYGAETRVRGFSGYMAELLVITYGSFRGVLRAAAGWEPPVYIDPEGVGDEDALRRKYRDAPIIVVDPVDPGRNAAGAVSMESLSKFILASRLYLERPHEWFFHVAQPNRPLGGTLRAGLLRLECRGSLGRHPPDAIWGILTRSAKLLARELAGKGFLPLIYEAWTDESTEAHILVALESCRLPEGESLSGPQVLSSTERITRFAVKRLREGGAVWPSGEKLVGQRPRSAVYRSAASTALLWLSSSGSEPLRRLGLDCTVRCEACTRKERICSPTPPWIAYLSEA
ncbi:MAG: CCA tRNA nucleotidyltransferase [Desulfurococcales archaeon]|nr:CCA tRNA nucleotidyltransferase [Desulfurococcales archaeon]